MKSFDFEEFETEEDIEQAFDDMIRDLADEITLAEADPAIVNPVKVYQIKFVHEAMKYLTRLRMQRSHMTYTSHLKVWVMFLSKVKRLQSETPYGLTEPLGLLVTWRSIHLLTGNLD